MDKNELKKEIDVLIESIKKQADRMNAQDNLTMVELEVLHHKIQKLYEKSILIHHLPALPPALPPVNQPREPLAREEEPVKPIPISNPPQEIIAAATAVHTPEPTPLSPVKEIQRTLVESIPTPDLFGASAQTNQKPALKAKPERDKPARMMRLAVADLQKAISINDKFRFINELFDGNVKEYQAALQSVNTCGNFEDADRYVSNIREIYGWNEENEVVGIFMDLVERRFL